MKVTVDGWESGYPYAHIKESGYGEYYLGENRILGNSLNGRIFGVDERLANAEEMPMTIHTVVDSLWQAGVQTEEYAALAVLTNLMLPRVLRHLHPEITSSKHKAIYLYTQAVIIDLSILALDKLLVQVEEGVEVENPHTPQHTIATIHNLKEFCKNRNTIPDPRSFRLHLNGILTTA